MSSIPVHRYPPRYGPRPRLSPIEVREVNVDGQRLFAVRAVGAADDQSVVLSPEALAIANFFDGSRDLREVQLSIHRQYGELLYIERIHELASALDKAGLFEGRRKPAADAEASTDPGRRAVRVPLHAGSAYEADPTRLRAELDASFLHPEGPGALPNGPGERIAGIVVPHIDLARGGPVYAHAYKALAEGTDADFFVVFGTAHASPEQLFSVTRLHYDTPLGPVPTDARAIAQLEELLGDAVFRGGEDVHKEEHSIEFQALYLRYLYGDRPITMLPVLCSTLYPVWQRGARPGDDADVQRFLDALARITRGRKVCFIAAADLSHVGQLYGDELPPNDHDLAALARRDQDSLAYVQRGDADGFFNHVGPDGETRRICGLTPIYMALRATGGAPARLLRYAQWNGSEHGSAVTYAAATLLPS